MCTVAVVQELIGADEQNADDLNLTDHQLNTALPLTNTLASKRYSSYHYCCLKQLFYGHAAAG
jgi:hypothetical protein